MCIEFRNVSLNLSKKSILLDINITIKKGFVLLYGESGSGKSSFLKLINMLYSPTSGNIFYKGKNINSYQTSIWRSMCMLVRQMPMFVEGSVVDNIKFPFSFRANKDKVFDDKLLDNLLDRFKLNKTILQKDVSTLSGGEAQRISIIRTVLLKPKIYLFDEPTSALDVYLQDDIFSFIKEISINHICIVCSHAKEAEKWCDVSLRVANKRVLYD